MQFYKYLYVQSDIKEKKKSKIIEKLKNNKIQPNIHVIALSSNPANHLDIIPSILLLQPGYDTEDLFVVGIATGNQEAIIMVKDILEEVYNETKGTDIRSFILKQEQS